jgi:branched-chain amino acid transport system substrate-binding protein
MNRQRLVSWFPRAGLAALIVALAVAAGACGGDEEAATTEAAPATTAAETEAPAETTEAAETGAPAETTETAPAESSGCGLANGEEATGEPLKVGSVISNAGGIDFSSAAEAATAFFKCVNANGGINGRPIEITVENDELNPEKAGQVAAKLVESDQVLALVANTSFVDCAVNGQYYQDNGYNIVYGVGIPFQCFQSPPFAATNMGPRYSGMGAARYAVEVLGATKLVAVAGNIPNVGDYTVSGIEAYANEAGVEFSSFTPDIPVKDPQSVAVRAANEAGADGAVVLVMPVPEDIAVLNAAEAAGVASQTKWTCATPCNDLSFPGAVSDYWKDGTIFVNSELNLIDSPGPDNQLWLQVMDEYGEPDNPRDNFSQAGFLAAKILTDTLLQLPEDQLTQEGINAAIAEITNYQTDLLCKPWYYGPGPNHVPNNADWTVVLQGDTFAEAEGCVDIPGSDDVLPVVREQEQELGLNTGG